MIYFMNFSLTTERNFVFVHHQSNDIANPLPHFGEPRPQCLHLQTLAMRLPLFFRTSKEWPVVYRQKINFHAKDTFTIVALDHACFDMRMWLRQIHTGCFPQTIHPGETAHQPTQLLPTASGNTFWDPRRRGYSYPTYNLDMRFTRESPLCWKGIHLC